MTGLQRWRASDLPALVDRINKYSIGLDDYFDRLADLNGTATNYPPYNLVQVSNVEYRLELALAGFKKTDVKVYTEHGRTYVEGKKESDEHSPEYLHRGVDPNDLSPEHGVYQMKRKLDQLHLRMGYFQ